MRELPTLSASPHSEVNSSSQSSKQASGGSRLAVLRRQLVAGGAQEEAGFAHQTADAAFGSERQGGRDPGCRRLSFVHGSVFVSPPRARDAVERLPEPKRDTGFRNPPGRQGGRSCTPSPPPPRAGRQGASPWPPPGLSKSSPPSPSQGALNPTCIARIQASERQAQSIVPPPAGLSTPPGEQSPGTGTECSELVSSPRPRDLISPHEMAVGPPHTHTQTHRNTQRHTHTHTPPSQGARGVGMLMLKTEESERRAADAKERRQRLARMRTLVRVGNRQDD